MSAVASTNSFAGGVQAIATAYGDYTKKSFEDTRSFVEKLSGVKSLDKAIEIQTEFAKSAFETFVAESQKIGALYRDLAKQAYKPFGGLPAKCLDKSITLTLAMSVQNCPAHRGACLNREPLPSRVSRGDIMSHVNSAFPEFFPRSSGGDRRKRGI